MGKPLNKAWESWKLCDFFFAQFVSANNWIGTINSPVSRPEVLQTSLKIRTWMCCREDLKIYERGRIKCWIGCLQISEWSDLFGWVIRTNKKWVNHIASSHCGSYKGLFWTTVRFHLDWMSNRMLDGMLDRMSQCVSDEGLFFSCMFENSYSLCFSPVQCS